MLHKRYKQKRNRNPIINILFYIVSYWTNLEILFSGTFLLIIKKLINKQKMFWNILCLSAQNSTFPYPKTYCSDLRNVRFPYAKHKTYTFILQSTQWDFPLYPSPLTTPESGIFREDFPQKGKYLSFFDKIFLFFFCSSKIISTFAYRKTINIYRIQTQTNTIIYTQTRTIMKKTFTKKTLAAGIAAAWWHWQPQM